jgi:hypothetical protein
VRRVDVLLGIGLALLVGFIGYQAVTTRSAQTPRSVADSATGGGPPVAATGGPNEVIVSESRLPAPVRDIDAIRRRLRDGGHGTYVDELLRARDSSIARWSNRRGDPVRVWINERPGIDGFDPSFTSEVRRAFVEWGAAGVPLAFTFVPDSGRSEVRVSFVDRFDGPMSGRTLWERDPNWWIVGGTIELSLRSGRGQLLTPPQFHAVALHEVGHLLGLDHTADSTAIMAPSIRVLALGPHDIATLRLIYEVPPGPIGRR